MKTQNYLWIVLILSQFGFSQNDGALPLKKIIENIAAKHQVKFSYIAEELSVYRLAPPEDKLSLKSKLDYLTRNTRLHFKEIAIGYFTIYNDQSMDKPLCGFLIDIQTGNGIENAIISILKLGVSSSSDSNGYFELPVLAPDEIEIKHLGYQTKYLRPQDLYRADCQKISMQLATRELTAVTAQRYLTTGISKDVLGTITVRPGKFGILPGLTEPDVLQAMQQVPGISSSDETFSNINVRGGAHDQNLFLWNGIRMFQTGHFFGLISAFNPMLSNRITISKNGSSAFSGESVSALIEMSSHTRVIDSCYNAIVVDLISANFFSKVKLSTNATIQAAGRRTFTDVFKTPTFKSYENRVFSNSNTNDLTTAVENTIVSDKYFYFYDFSLQYHQKINEQQEFIVNGIGIENKADFYQQDKTKQINSELSQKDFGGSLLWKSVWNSRHQTQFQGYFSKYALNAVSNNNFTKEFLQQGNKVLNDGIRIRHSYEISDHFKVDTGYQLDAINIKNTAKEINQTVPKQDSQKALSQAAIVEGYYQSEKSGTRLNAGLRVNYFEKFDTFRIEPRLAMSQKLTSKWSVELLAELKSQTLTQVVNKQEDFLDISKRKWVLANEKDIPIQKSKQLSIGFTYFDRDWLFTVDNFYKSIAGISNKSQELQNQYEFVFATGSYRVLGSEVLLQRNFSKFYTWASYVFNENQYTFDNNKTHSHAISWAGIYNWRHLKLALGAKWNTGQYYAQPLAVMFNLDNQSNAIIVYNSRNSEKIKDYFQANFSTSYFWSFNDNKILVASFSMLNILDRKNLLNRSYRINTEQSSVVATDTYGLGFTPNLSMKFTF